MRAPPTSLPSTVFDTEVSPPPECLSSELDGESPDELDWSDEPELPGSPDPDEPPEESEPESPESEESEPSEESECFEPPPLPFFVGTEYTTVCGPSAVT